MSGQREKRKPPESRDASLEKLGRIERAEQRLWLLALLLFLLLAVSLSLLDTTSLVADRGRGGWSGRMYGMARDYGPAAGLLVIAWLTCAYFYEKLVTLRAQNRSLVGALDASARTLAQRNQQLSTWSQLSHGMVTDFNLPRLLDLIVRTAAEMTESDCAAVILVEKGARHPRLAAIHERGLQIGLAERVAEAVVRSGRPLFVSPENPPEGLDRPDLPWEDLTSLGAAPLVTADRVVGALLVGRVSPREGFSEEVLEALESFAGQASVALEKATLYAENQRHLERMEKLLRDLGAAQKQLTEAVRTGGPGGISTGIAYVINRLTAPIMARADMLVNEPRWEEESAREEVAAIREEAGRAARALVGLLAISRQSATGGVEQVDVARTVRQTLDIMRKEYSASGIEVVESYEPVPDIEASSCQLQQALLNIFVSVLHGTASGGLVRVKTTMSEDDQIEVSVEYAPSVGSASPSSKALELLGMPQEDRLETNVGLRIAELIVGGHSGRMRVEGNGSAGTRISVTFPAPRLPDTAAASLDIGLLIGGAETTAAAPGGNHRALRGQSAVPSPGG